MKTETLKKELSRKCKCLGITLVGFVPVERWSSPQKELPNILSPWIPEEFWPQFIYPETKTGQVYIHIHNSRNTSEYD